MEEEVTRSALRREYLCERDGRCGGGLRGRSRAAMRRSGLLISDSPPPRFTRARNSQTREPSLLSLTEGSSRLFHTFNLGLALFSFGFGLGFLLVFMPPVTVVFSSANGPVHFPTWASGFVTSRPPR